MAICLDPSSDIKCDTSSDTSFDTICDKIDFYEITRYITC